MATQPRTAVADPESTLLSQIDASEAALRAADAGA